ncbi:MAG TPA: DUF1844 domain-containing protein [candidate division Zixibacteria bacterium]|jgi:hypothetical protein
MDQTPTLDVHLMGLIISLQTAAIMQMGKTIHPATGKIERDLDSARHSIDLLEMLRRKTQGNLAPEESQLLDHVLYELRMNFVEEMNKPIETAPSVAEADSPPTDASPQSDTPI